MRQSTLGFTLIELSIVLVIIGLIVGGVLVGRNLIDAAAIRAQITQIEKFNTATNIFYGKYGYLPGDIPAGSATMFGFTAGSGAGGHGDGNGTLEACSATHGYGRSVNCEAMLFWVHLSQAGLIENGFNLAGNTVSADSGPTLTTSNIDSFLPQAKLGNGNYVAAFYDSNFLNSYNYFFVGGITAQTAGTWQADYTATNNITPAQAYAIDNKTDDGFPGTGRMLTIGLNGNSTSYPGFGNGGSSSGNCLASGGTAYKVAYTGPACQFLIQFQ